MVVSNVKVSKKRYKDLRELAQAVREEHDYTMPQFGIATFALVAMYQCATMGMTEFTPELIDAARQWAKMEEPE